jgi:hypothetical protein
MKILFIAVLILTTTPAFSWHRTGHMLVAQIAQNILLQTPLGTKVYQKAYSLLTPFSKYCGERQDPFIEAAVWPDKLFGDNVNAMFNWHFTDQILTSNNTQSNLPFLKKKFHRQLSIPESTHTT